jgi:hypothetical protein
MRMTLLLLSIVSTSFFIASEHTLAQGSLTPPGAPAPTMKTLDQVEARIDINRLGGDGTSVAIITNPGSYYLTGDLAGADGKDTIRVASSGRVTIDLNGFALTSTGADRAAIVVPSANEAIQIRNGTIIASGGTTTRAVSGGNRVACNDLNILGSSGGTLIALGTDITIRRCRLTDGGISLGDRSHLNDSTISGTTDISITLGTDSSAVLVKFKTNRGALTVSSRALIADCEINAVGAPTAFGLTGNVVQTGDAAVVRHCTVSAGTIAGNAIGVGSGSIVESCRVLSAFREGILSNIQNNVTVVDCSVQGHGRRGIFLGPNAQVRNCSVVGSGTDGIFVEGNSIVSGCTVTGAAGGGIVSTLDNVSVSKCVVQNTTGGPGISLLSGSIVECDVTGTTGGPGIQVTQTSRIERNRSASNGTVSPANPQSGIKVIGANNRVEGNQLVSNAGFALEITGAGSTGNLVINNHARDNAAGVFSVVAGNAVGALVPLASTATDTHPSANYVP